MRFTNNIPASLPGLGLSCLVAAAGYALAFGEQSLLGKTWLEPLVLAILIGAAARSAWTPTERWHPGIHLSAKSLLEIAVVLLGASVSEQSLVAAGTRLLIGIVAVVSISIPVSYAFGRLLRLPSRMALLVACGNSICGNSAIAAVAPVIGADSDDVAASIAFTAALGVAVVLLLPVIGAAAGMSDIGLGVLSGLTVYAVPQVLAATAPFGPIAVQTGTLVKLVRVLLLGPVCLVLSLVAPRLPPQPQPGELSEASTVTRPRLAQLVPWFILGFLLLMVCRSAGWVPAPLLAPINNIAGVLTVISMAALGLGVDVRAVVRAGAAVTSSVLLSLLALGAISASLLMVLGLR